jgi:urease accessory protein
VEARAAQTEADGAGAGSSAGWQAELTLGFAAREGGGTVLAHRTHRGPLAVQRPFFPEGPGVCHVYLLHPPGGLVGGDHLSIRAHVAAGAHALCTTPAATKVYRTRALPARQQQALTVAAGATLEWLPQETIVYDGADVELSTRVDMEPGARVLALELVCLGLPARAEPFRRGRCRQRLELWRAGLPLAVERARWHGGDPALAASWGLGGAPVTGTLLGAPAPAGRAEAQALVDELRALAEALPAGDAGSVTALAGGEVLACRYLGPSAERGRAFLHAAWCILRPSIAGRAPSAPRIWAT